jgi:hypothetical protein
MLLPLRLKTLEKVDEISTESDSRFERKSILFCPSILTAVVSIGLKTVGDGNSKDLEGTCVLSFLGLVTASIFFWPVVVLNL